MKRKASGSISKGSNSHKDLSSDTMLIELVFPFNSPSLNRMQKQRYMDARMKDKIKSEMIKQIKEKYGIPFPRAKGDVTIEYTRIGKRILDHVNAVGSLKWWEDRLVELEICPNDRPVDDGGCMNMPIVHQIKGEPGTILRVFVQA